MEPAMRLTFEQVPGDVIGHVSGRLDSQTSEEFEHILLEFLESKPPKTLLDMAQVNYVSSAGIRAILRAYRAVAKYKGVIRLSNLQPQVRKVFDFINLVPPSTLFGNSDSMDPFFHRIQTEENPESGK